MITLKEFKEDYNWQHAFHEANHHCYGPCGFNSEEVDVGPINEVEEIIACDPGEQDCRSWLAITKMKNGTFAVMEAGCDYTGWD